MLSTLQPTTDSLSGDYYGTVYKGSLLIPALVIILIGVAIWLYVKTRNR